MENFKMELLGNVLLSSYFAWIVWAMIGQVLATLIRNHIPSLKSYPVNAVQILTGLLVILVFIRFGFELTNYTPTAFGAFLIGLGGNEVALAFLKKYLNRKKQEQDNIPDAVAMDQPIQGGGTKNDPPPKP